MQSLHTVYDFANEPMRMTFLFPVPFAIFGLIILIYHLNLKKQEDGVHGPFNPIFQGADSKGIDTRVKGIVLGVLFILIGSILTPLFYFGQLPLYTFYKRVCKEKSYTIIEGRITHFHHSNSPYHDTERFSINDANFVFGDYSTDGFGYSTGSLKYDPLRSNLLVKICYIDDGTRNVILKLETE